MGCVKPKTKHVLTGLDRIRDGQWERLKGHRLGLLSNQASLDSSLEPARNVIYRLLPGHLKALFGPQHGYGGEDQDNMVETRHSHDEALDIPVFSLYAETRDLLPTMFEHIDILIIDLQDVGTRVYTFASTMLNCLRAAARDDKKVLVLDRPNPLGGEVVEGKVMSPEFYSFVGPFSLPMRHGLTMGEMALIFNDVFNLGCNLEVIPMGGWKREMLWHETGLIWIMPSPNMPLPQTAYVYPGQVIWEGTNISEGRGTCRPFEIFGGPYLDTKAVKKELDPKAEAGCCLQEYSFRPTFHKWKGEVCKGFMLHVLDPHLFRPFLTSMAVLKAIITIHQRDFVWIAPPYEYEYHRKPIDLILGDSLLRRDLESNTPLSVMEEKWMVDLESFDRWRRPYLLY